MITKELVYVVKTYNTLCENFLSSFLPQARAPAILGMG